MWGAVWPLATRCDQLCKNCRNITANAAKLSHVASMPVVVHGCGVTHCVRALHATRCDFGVCLLLILRGSRSRLHASRQTVARMKQRWPGRRRGWLSCVLLTAAACAAPGSGQALLDRPSDIEVGRSAVHVRFEPGQGAPLAFGAVPWPDDLYLNKQSRVELGELPGAPARLSEYQRALRDSLSDLDGFGISTPIFFFTEGGIDAKTLPKTPAESLDTRSSVFMIDADSGSPTAFERVAVEVLWSPQLSRLALRPAVGQSLTPGRRYAALVTRRVRDLAGRALEPAPKFAAVRDPSVSLSDARLLQARAEYTPVLETLAKMDLPREDIVAMAVFRVQTVTPDLDAARRVVRSPRSGPPAPMAVVSIGATGLDAALGVARSSATAAAHENLRAMIHGMLPTPNFVSTTAKVHGAWTHGVTQELELKRSDEQVPFTLFVPKGDEPAPIVIYQHQRGRERSDAVAVANALARQNIAVIAIDAPFQGLRARPTSSKAIDSRNRFTGADTPDGFGDEQGDFYGAQDTMGSLVPLHPFYMRDALRQGVVDLMNVVRFIEEGDLSALTADVADNRRFAQRRFGFIGEDVGAQMGVMLATVEPKVAAVALVGAGAFVSEGLWLGATEQPLFAQLSSWLGRDPSRLDFANDPPSLWPELGLFETLMGRSETLAYAAVLRRAPVNVLLMMAAHDETVANLSTEALSSALGARLLGGSARYFPELASSDANNGDMVESEFRVEDNLVMRLLNNYDPADHHLLQAARGQRLYEDPVEAPFQARQTPESFDNPREAALDMLASYFSSFFTCVGTSDSVTTTLPCGADVTVYR